MGEALRGRAGERGPLREPRGRGGGEVPGRAERSRSASRVHPASYPGPSPPVLSPASHTWLVASGGGEGLGKFVATSLSREPLGRWALKLEPRVCEPKYSACGALAGDRGRVPEGDLRFGLGLAAAGRACCLSWGCGRTGEAPGSSHFPATAHTPEQRPSPAFFHCRAPRASALGLESRNAGDRGSGE